SFLPFVPISEPDAEVNSHGENSPTIAVTGTEICALWEQRAATGSRDLMFARSLSYGHNFEKPIRITDKTVPSFNGFSSLAVAPNGDIYAVWLDARDQPQPPGTFALYFAKSTDHGATFSRNVRVSTGVCPCCRPTLAFGSKGEIFIAWRKVFDGDVRDMVIATSNNGGETFAEPVRVAVDNWRISGCPDSGPVLAQQGERLYIAWFTEAEGKAGVRLSWSNDGAQTFTPPIIVSSNILDANHPSFSTSEDGKTLLVFVGRDPTQKQRWSTLQPYLVEIGGAGEVTQPIPVPGSQKVNSYSAIAAGTVGRVFIAWAELKENGESVILSRGRNQF
ncbi:MAG: sialidase family protein, partial [Pyrinomonadaceae bacterium]